MAKPPSTSSARTFRPSDIPGTLLNVALLNLGSTRINLRVAAYHMLTSLWKNANCSFNVQFLVVTGMNFIFIVFFSYTNYQLGLCIPKNCTAFVVKVSEKLARTETNLTLEFLLECLHGMSKVCSSS